MPDVPISRSGREMERGNVLNFFKGKAVQFGAAGHGREVSPVQLLNAERPILVTLSDIVRVVSPEQVEKAEL